MYFVKYGKEYLHDPRIDGLMLLDLSLDCEENSCGYCDFTIYPNHPMYDKLKERDADNQIEVYDDDIMLFAGFIYELGKEFYLDGHVKCKGELDYLNETIIRPYAMTNRGYGLNAPTTVNGYFNWLIEQHNEQANPNKRFTVGINQGDLLKSDNQILRENDEYPRTIEEIASKLLDDPGGYIRTRHEDGVRYIDYIAEWTESNAQILDFGVNLTNYTQTDDSADISTFVVPLGARMRDTEYWYDDGYFESEDVTVDAEKEYYTETNDGYLRCEDLVSFEAGETYYESDDNGYYITSDASVDENKQYYVVNPYIEGYSRCDEDMTFFKDGVTYYEYNELNDESEQLLTIGGLPDGTYVEEGYKKSEDIIYNEPAVNKYGWIGMTYKDTDLVTKEDLIDASVVALKPLISPKRTIEIKAVDTHLVNPSIKPIRIGEYVRVRSKPHNLDSYFLCLSIALDLNNPENSLYILGTTFDTLTGQQNKKINALNSNVNKQIESVSLAATEIKDVIKETKKTSANSVTSVIEEYAVSQDPNTVPESGWSTSVPEYGSDVFVWRKMVTTTGGGAVTVSPPSCVTGNAGAPGEDAVLLRIDSSRGTVFKNDSISTVLSAVIYKGGTRITDIATLRSTIGSGAYLEWSWQRIDDNAFGVISSSDSMIGNDGFTLTISADEVDTKVTFMCELKI